MSAIWQRWKFRINALLLILPCWFFYDSLTPEFPDPWVEQSVGPFTAAPSPLNGEPPYVFEGMLLKDFSVRLCEGCSEKLRLAFLTVDSGAPTLAELEPLEIGILHGSPYGQHVHVPYPEQLGPDHRLWLTLQTWDGQLHQTAWDLPR